MRLKIFLLILSVSLVGTGIWIKLEERKEILAAVEVLQRKWVPAFDLHSVAEVVIKSNTDSVILSKNGETWVVDGDALKKANISAVGQLVQSVQNLKPTEEINATPSQFASFELLEPGSGSSGTGLMVELRDKSANRLAAIIIGKQSFARPDPKSPFPAPPNGRFIIPVGSSGPIGMVSDGFDGISPKSADWLQVEPD